MGVANDRELCQSYSDRTFWSVITHGQTVSLVRLDLCK